jgi:hypothetical protein
MLDLFSYMPDRLMRLKSHGRGLSLEVTESFTYGQA